MLKGLAMLCVTVVSSCLNLLSPAVNSFMFLTLSKSSGSLITFNIKPLLINSLLVFPYHSLVYKLSQNNLKSRSSFYQQMKLAQVCLRHLKSHSWNSESHDRHFILISRSRINSVQVRSSNKRATESLCIFIICDVTRFRSNVFIKKLIIKRCCCAVLFGVLDFSHLESLRISWI